MIYLFLLLLMMTGAVAGASELDVPAPFADPVEERFGQLWIMENVSPSGKGLLVVKRVEEGLDVALDKRKAEREYVREADGDFEAHLVALTDL